MVWEKGCFRCCGLFGVFFFFSPKHSCVYFKISTEAPTWIGRPRGQSVLRETPMQTAALITGCRWGGTKLTTRSPGARRFHCRERRTGQAHCSFVPMGNWKEQQFKNEHPFYCPLSDNLLGMISLMYNQVANSIKYLGKQMSFEYIITTVDPRIP